MTERYIINYLKKIIPLKVMARKSKMGIMATSLICQISCLIPNVKM